MKRVYSGIVLVLLVAFTGSVPASALTAQEQTRLQTIITRGDQEIDRRVKALNAAAKVINEAKKLSDANNHTLTEEVTDAVSGLTALKTKLDAETTLVGARADAQSIISDYRIYALVLPKVRLVKVADEQIAVAAKFTALSAEFMQRFAELKTAGKDTSALEATLSNMNTKVADANTAAMAVESKVIILQPSDYNTDHTVLSGYRDQLKTARMQLEDARKDAKTIVEGIKALKS